LAVPARRKLFPYGGIDRDVPQATFGVCPECGAKVRKEKLRRHISGVHGAGPKPPKKEVAEPSLPTVRFPWKMFAALGVVALVVLSGYWALTHLPAGGGTTPGTRVAVMETNYGTIKIRIETGPAPVTGGHFIDLVTAGSYDGNSFHRVAVINDVGFVIQGGALSGAGGVNWENTRLTNVKYSIAMARSGDANDQAYKDTGTSQFFINLKDNPSLDAYAYPYVVFGRVIEGQSVVDAIGRLYPSGQSNYDGQPISPVSIIRVYMES